MEKNIYSFPQGYPVEKEKWVQSAETCSACHKMLNMFTTKGNCGCCGRIFCSSCLTAQLSFGPHTTPFQVCLECFQKVQDHRRVNSVPNRTELTHVDSPQSTDKDENNNQMLLEGNIQSLLEKSSQLRRENEELLRVHVLETNDREATICTINHLQQEASDLRAAKSSAERRAQEVADALVGERDAFRSQRAAQAAETHRLEEALAEQTRKWQSSTAEVAAREQELQRVRDRVNALEAKEAALAAAQQQWSETEASYHESVQRAEEARRQAVLENERLLMEVRELEQANAESLQKLDEANAALCLKESRQTDDDAASLSRGRWGRLSIVRDTSVDLPLVRIDALPSAASFFEWGYDIVEAKSRVSSILQSAAAHVARSWSLFESDEALEAWYNYVALIESNYRDNYYHNATHAADVLQGLASLVTLCGDLFSKMTRIEKLAVIFASMVHDVKHPGRSQAFLKNTFDPVYLQYNGQSVLEQMHLATAFSLLAVPSADFTRAMNDDEAVLFHSLATSMVLKTDMAVHAACMEKVGSHTGQHPYVLENAADRLEVLSFILHCADIGATTKGVEVALKWTGITDEMYAQGDDERERGLPLSPGSDRKANLVRGQLFFIEYFVFPTFDLLHQLFSEASEPLTRLAQLVEYYQEEAGVEKKMMTSKSYIDKGELMERTIFELQSECTELKKSSTAEVASAFEVLKGLQTKMEEVVSIDSRVLNKVHMYNERLQHADEKIHSLIFHAEVQGGRNRCEQQDALQNAMKHIRAKAAELALREKSITEREQGLQREEAGVSYEVVLNAINQHVADIEERESRIALYSENLADIAHKMNYQKKRLSEARNLSRGKTSTSSFSGPCAMVRYQRLPVAEEETVDDVQRHLSSALEHLIVALNR